MKLKKFLCFALYITLMFSIGTYPAIASTDGAKSSPFTIENGKLSNNYKLQNTLDEYFKLRGEMFIKDKHNEKSLKYDTKKFSASNKVLDDALVRLSSIADVQKEKKTYFVSAEVIPSIRQAYVQSGDSVKLSVYEWTWVDYNEGMDRFGYATEHEMVVQAINDTYSIISDNYDESDIIGMQSEGYIAPEIESIPPIDVLDNSQLNIVMALPGTTYDVGKAVDYADKWVYKGIYSGMNTSYYNLAEFGYSSSDCANYVSQCLYNGGIPFNEGTGRLNTSTTQWWFDTSATNKIDNYDISPMPWRHVNSFANYWIAQGVTSVNSTQSNSYPGNPVYFIRSDGTGHVWICTGYNSSGVPIFNAHNNDVYHVPYTYLGGGTLKTLQFKSSNVTLNTPSTAYNLGGTGSASVNRTLQAGEFQFFKFTVPTGSPYSVYTSNSAFDTYGYLYEESMVSGSTTLGMIEIARDDDSGDLTNFKYTAVLLPGKTYYIKVRGYNNTGAGSFTINLTRFL